MLPNLFVPLALEANQMRNLCCTLSKRFRCVLAAPEQTTLPYSRIDLTLAKYAVSRAFDFADIEKIRLRSPQSGRENIFWHISTSSAHNIHLDDFTTEGRSLMKRENSKGARRAPSGTQDFTLSPAVHNHPLFSFRQTRDEPTISFAMYAVTLSQFV